MVSKEAARTCVSSVTDEGIALTICPPFVMIEWMRTYLPSVYFSRSALTAPRPRFAA